MKSIDLVFQVEPVAKGRPRVSKWGVYTPAKTRKFEKTVKDQALVQMLLKRLPVLTEPLEVRLEIICTRPKKPTNPYPSRSDLDNYGKAICDALNEVVWKDDSQIVDLYMTKRWGESGVIIVKINPLESAQL